jgi:Sigma-70, region 4
VAVHDRRRRAIDEGRRRSRRPAVPLQTTPLSLLPVTADAADVALERLATHAAIGLLSTLPPLQAEVILLRVVAGLDTEVVARMLGRSPGAVSLAGGRVRDRGHVPGGPAGGNGTAGRCRGGLQPVADVLAALRGAPTGDELAGETAAMAVYRQVAGVSRQPRRTRRRRP